MNCTPEFLIALYEQGRFVELMQLSEGVDDADILCMRAFAKTAGWGCSKDMVGAKAIVGKLLEGVKNRAQKGIVVSQVNLGKIYHDGLGVSCDYVVAVGWYRKAAGQGNVRGRANLGWTYENCREIDSGLWGDGLFVPAQRDLSYKAEMVPIPTIFTAAVCCTTKGIRQWTRLP